MHRFTRTTLARSDSDDLFFLIARGKFLFTNARIETPHSFREVLERCSENGSLPLELTQRLHSLANRFITPEMVGTLELKSFIYQLVNSVIHGHCKLKSDALDALYRSRPDYIKAIPGVTPPAERKMGRALWARELHWDDAALKNTPLARLIDQTTFQKFHFVRLVG